MESYLAPILAFQLDVYELFNLIW